MSRVFFVFLIVVLLGACNNKHSKHTENTDSYLENLVVSGNDSIMQDFVFYGSPSPLEINNLYSPENFNYQKLAPLKDYSSVTSDKNLSLLCGIYMADLSFLILSEKNTEQVYKYADRIFDILLHLGINKALIDSFATEIENNINDTAKLQRIIANFSFQTDSYMKTSGQYQNAYLMLLGAWIEANYILTEIARNSENKDSLYKIIADQFYAVKNIMHNSGFQLLESQNQELIKKLADSYQKLLVFDSVKKYDPLQEETFYKKTVTYDITSGKIANLERQIKEIRNEILNQNFF